MPTYDYLCQECGHRFEKFQPITSKPVRVCPKCRKRKVKRLIGTGAGVIFKGSGFYQTDYRSESYKKGAEKDKPKSDSTKGDSSKSTAKEPSAKPDANSKSSDAPRGQ